MNKKEIEAYNKGIDDAFNVVNKYIRKNLNRILPVWVSDGTEIGSTMVDVLNEDIRETIRVNVVKLKK